ncbi:MAG: hypothetical protein K6U80_14925 [Firmicutes bacterium]|nr:hypothetical protein [Bacillota bacterium]
MGLYYFYKNMKEIKFKLKHCYYGDKDENLDIVLKGERYKNFIAEVSDNTDKIVEDMIEEPIVASAVRQWFRPSLVLSC